jgi:hypothetical protein
MITININSNSKKSKISKNIYLQNNLHKSKSDFATNPTSQQRSTSRQRIKQQYLPVFDKTEKTGGVTAVYIGGFESNEIALVKLDRYKFKK